MQENPIIEFDSVGFSYDRRLCALDDASFKVSAGELICIIGENGSGKSTIAKLIDGLLIPDTGCVRIFGMDTSSDENVFAIRSKTGYVFQNPVDQVVNSIVENEVAFGPENLGLSSDEIRRRVDRSLERVGMSHLAKCDVNKLSGGQLQRVSLADALAMNPELLIFDEATSMLDPVASTEFLSLVQKLRDEGVTIVMITHGEAEARLADRIIVLEAGRITYDGAPDDSVIARVFPPLPTHDELEYYAREHMATQRSEDAGASVDTNTDAVADTDVDAGAGANGGSAPMITFDKVSYSYDAPKRKRRQDIAPIHSALDRIDLTINAGDAVAIMGPNGSGKSTLVKHMNGLLKPNAGKVSVKGIPTSDRRGANKARRIVGLCFQYAERQLFAQTVYDDIAYGPLNAGCDEDEIDLRVRQAMDDVMLDFRTFARRSPFKLSGGQQRRVALAGVLAMDPDVLVLDEPCASLDPKTHIEFLYLIARLKAAGKTIVMITHDEQEAKLLGERTITMKDGRIIATDAS